MKRRVLTAAIALLIACGGKAIIDPGSQNEGGGGATTMSGQTTTGPTTALVNVGIGPGGGVGGAPECQAACASLGDCGGPAANCVDNCENISPACRDLHQIWLGCSLGEINTMCGEIPPQVCAPQLQDYLSCSGILAGEEACFQGGDGSCTCDGFISPGISIRQECTPNAGCRCIAGDNVIGFCAPNESLCGITTGCCAGLFFTGPE